MRLTYQRQNNRAWGSQKGSRIKRKCRTHKGLRMIRTHLQTRQQCQKPRTYLLRGAGPHVGEPKRLESPTDVSEACTHTLSVADDSRRPTDMPERVRKSQDDCKKSNLPAASPKPCKHAGLPEPGLISIYTVCGTEYYLLSISAFWRNG